MLKQFFLKLLPPLRCNVTRGIWMYRNDAGNLTVLRHMGDLQYCESVVWRSPEKRHTRHEGPQQGEVHSGDTRPEQSLYLGFKRLRPDSRASFTKCKKTIVLLLCYVVVFGCYYRCNYYCDGIDDMLLVGITIVVIVFFIVDIISLLHYYYQCYIIIITITIISVIIIVGLSK